MSTQTLVESISRSDTFPIVVQVSADSNKGYITVTSSNFTPQMFYELPAIKFEIYTDVNGTKVKLKNFCKTVNTYSPVLSDDVSISVPVDNVPESFYMYITPMFDGESIAARNMLIENGIESGDLWDTPTDDFSISIDFEAVESSGGGGTPEQTITTDGTPPLSFESNGSAASAYSITGDMVQTGTPSTSTPVYPQEVGDLVASGEHAGEYAITMEIGGTTKTIYLNEPLRKIGDYTDTVDSEGTVTRNIAMIELKGTEPISYTGGMHKISFDAQEWTPPKYLRELKLIAVCSHYQPIANQAQASLSNGELTFLVSGSGTNNMYIRDTSYANATEFKAYLAAQYSAGTPVRVWYIRATAGTETESVPTLTPSKGSNTLVFDTTLQPSYASITCTIGGGGGGGGATSATKVSYSNSTSGLTATNVQKAIDELSSIPKQLYGIGFTRDTGNLATGESLTLDATNVKKDNTFSFMAKITSFSKILVGQGFEVYSGAWAEITDTKLIVHNYAQSDTTVEYTHGLTISDYIYVQIFVGVSKADIVIYSNGNSFKQSNANWFGCNGTYFAKSDGSTLTDCVLTWSSADFQKPIWVFGDSYIGLNNVKRWATQFKNAGFADNVLFNGYAGEASSDAVIALTNALALGKPKKLVWCLGMNDGADNGNTPSAKYSSGISQVESLCASNGIELIYATIPSVPNQNNEGKNTYVRGTGKRYIDFAKAVGASSSGVWYAGMLDTDNVHPTEAGAIALYHRAIADCPELTY